MGEISCFGIEYKQYNDFLEECTPHAQVKEEVLETLDFDHFTTKQLASEVRKSGLYHSDMIIERMEDLFENKNREFEILTEEYAGIRREKDILEIDLEDENNHLCGENYLLREEKNQLKKEKDQLKKEKDQLKKEKDQLKNEKDQLKKEKDQLKKEKDQLKKEKDQLRDDLKTVKRNMNSWTVGPCNTTTLWNKYVSEIVRSRYINL